MVFHIRIHGNHCRVNKQDFSSAPSRIHSPICAICKAIKIFRPPLIHAQLLKSRTLLLARMSLVLSQCDFSGISAVLFKKLHFSKIRRRVRFLSQLCQAPFIFCVPSYIPCSSKTLLPVLHDDFRHISRLPRRELCVEPP